MKKCDDDLKQKIYEDYLTGDLSVRAIGRKWGVASTTIGRWAKVDHWDVERNALLNGAKPAHTGKNFDKIVDAMEDRALKIRQATDLAMGKIMQLLELDEPLAPRDLKSITSSIMDLKVLYGVKHDDERRETEARIRNLERSLDQNTTDTEMKIEFVNMEWDTDGNT